jgi:hypothetical protein
MDMAFTIGLMAENMQVSGLMVNSMVREYSLQLLVWKDKVFGRTVRESVGPIVNDFFIR